MKAFMPALWLSGCTALAAGAAAADEVSDTLQGALDAYNSGDTAYALEELDYARQLLLALQADALSALLPAAPEGWTREVSTQSTAGLGMMGGGTGAEADYTGPEGAVSITLMADNPMVGAMSGMIANAAMYGARVERVGREKFMVQDREVTGLVGNRILVKGSGDDLQTVLDLIGTMDFAALKAHGQ